MARGIHSRLGPVALDALAEMASIQQFISLVTIAIASPLMGAGLPPTALYVVEKWKSRHLERSRPSHSRASAAAKSLDPRLRGNDGVETAEPAPAEAGERPMRAGRPCPNGTPDPRRPASLESGTGRRISLRHLARDPTDQESSPRPRSGRTPRRGSHAAAGLVSLPGVEAMQGKRRWS